MRRRETEEYPGAELYREFEEYIEEQQVRDAFCLLMDRLALSPRLTPSLKGGQGQKKSCKLHDQSGKQPYSFIVNKGTRSPGLLFYFRLPEVRSKLDWDCLKGYFPSLKVANKKGEWTIRLQTEADVQRLSKYVEGIADSPESVRQ